MGAARHRRVARNGPHIIGPAPGWKPAGIKYERSGLTYDDIAALLDGTIAREKALEAERDRLRAALDEAEGRLHALAVMKVEGTNLSGGLGARHGFGGDQ